MYRYIDMTKILFLLAFSVFLILNANAQTVQHINATSFSKLIKTQQGLILDVRTEQEYSRGHIDGSTLISTSDPKFAEKASLLQKDKPIYVYCLTGSRSYAVVNYLSQIGFSKLYNLQKGILEWHQLGYKIVQSCVVAVSESRTYNTSEFNTLIKSSNIVLVNFSASWCAPCKKLAPTIESIKSNFGSKIKVEKVDVESNKDLQTSCNVQSIPGLILYKNGKEYWRHTGLISYDELSKKINVHL